MRTPRVFVDFALAAEQRVSLPAGPSQHLVQVLRLRSGDPVILFNGDGTDFPSVLVEVARRGVVVKLGRPGTREPEPTLVVHLAIGISKGERMDFALQKAVELGVSSIAPLFSERSVVRLSGVRLDKRRQHWQGVTIAACEQSGRRRLPILHPAENLETWLPKDHGYSLLLDHRAETPLPLLPAPASELTLLIGPEGGLAPYERAQAHRAGFVGARLGPRILRTETAPLAALAVIQGLWGDLRR